MSHTVIIKLKSTGEVLAHSSDPEKLIRIEGNWYFHPDEVNRTELETSDRTYTCPHKGICFWVDLKLKHGYINDIAWVYPETLPKYKHIAGWYGFYPKHRHYSCESVTKT